MGQRDEEVQRETSVGLKMNIYKDYIKTIEDNEYLISMVPVDQILRFGYEAGLNESNRVLDLCCGYGTVLKIFSEAFGITGVGVDRDESFISIGKRRLKEAGIEKVSLICDDVTEYMDDEKYDMVIMSETIGSIADTLRLGEKFLEEDGILAYQKLYSKVKNPPKKLIEFDGEVLPLSTLNHIFNENGYFLIAMASDNDSAWERYVLNWSGRRDIERLKRDPSDTALREWIDKWYEMYFDYRREFEGQALFGLQRAE